jgi:hypothetical protein
MISTSSGRVGVDDPLATAPDRDDPHADLHRKLDIFERAVGELRFGAHAHAMRHLFRFRKVGDECRRNAQPVRDDVGDVDGSVAHALDRGDDVQDARDLLRVALRTTGEHTHFTHLVHELGQQLFQLGDFVGHAFVGEEQRRVAEVDHQLGGVLRLREHRLQVPWSVVHRCDRAQVSPKMMRDRISATAPSKSDVPETSGIPKLSGSRP